MVSPSNLPGAVAPRLVIVSGAPGSGKTMLACRLGAMLGFPVITKDDFKEVLYDTISTTDVGVTRALGPAAFSLLYLVAGRLLDANVSTIVEGNFWRGIAEAALVPLVCKGRAVLVQCGGDRETIVRRYRERAERGERHPGHRDLDVVPRLREQLTMGIFQPLDLNVPVLQVDTTGNDEYAPPFGEIVRFIEESRGQ